MRWLVPNPHRVMQELRRLADLLAIGFNATGANRRLRFGSRARVTAIDQIDICPDAPNRGDQAIPAAASLSRPRAESPAATIALASRPAVSYICSGDA